MAEGTVVDSLEVEISGSASKANKALDGIIKNIENLQRVMGGVSTKGFTDMLDNLGDASRGIKELANISKRTGEQIERAMGGSMKPMQENIKKVSDMAKELSDKYADLGKNFQFSGSNEQAQNEINKYTNALEKAKLKKQELEMAGTTDSKMYEYAIRDVQKYSNMIDALKAKMSEPMTFAGDLSALSTEELDKWFENLPTVKAQAEEVGEAISQSFEKADIPVKELNLDMAEMAGIMKETVFAQESTSGFEEGLGRIKEIAKDVSLWFGEIQDKISKAFMNSGIRTYTQEYVSLQNEISKTEKTLATLHAQMARGEATNNKFRRTTTYRKMQYDIAQAEKELRRLQDEQDRLELSGGTTKLNFGGMTAQLQNFHKSLQPVHNALAKINGSISGFIAKIRSLIAPTKSARKAIDGFSLSNSGLAKELFRTTKMLKLMVVRMALRSVIKNVQEGFQNLARYSAEFNQSMSELTSSSTYLSNSLAAMVAPIINALAPALEYLASLIVKVLNLVNQLFSALGGGTTFIAAKKNVTDYAKSLDKASGSAKKLNQTVLGIDELNINAGDKASGGGGASTINPADMFETLPIDSKIADMAKKAKDILSKLFDPLKAAWDKIGKSVMSSWEYALDEVWKLVKDIGRDFLRVWSEAETQRILEDILVIIRNIGLVVGNLAGKFREAWNHNEIGYKILANIRDIIGIIVREVRDMSSYTVEWSKNLNFYPLLEAMNGFLESLKPAVEGVMGVLKDFYTIVLLPLSKWTLEKGLPELFDVLGKFLDEINWEELRQGFADFWKVLEPFAEKVGEGLILFLDDVLQVCADIINSDIFKSVFAKLEEWMKNVTAEDIKNGLETMAGLIIGFKVAMLGLGAIEAINATLTTITTFLGWFGLGGGAEAAKGIGEVTTKIGLLSGAFDVLATSAAAVGVFEFIKDPLLDLTAKMDGNIETTERMKEKYDGWSGTLKMVGDTFSAVGQTIMGQKPYIEGVSDPATTLAHALEEIGNGAIYTDQKLSEMEGWGLTADDIETLRQAMLDANEDMRAFADENPEYWNASAEQIKNAMDSISTHSGEVISKIKADGYAGATAYAGEYQNIPNYVNKEAVAKGLIPTGVVDKWQSLAKDVADGYNNYLDSANVDGVTTFIQNGISAAQTAQDSHSPSKVYEGLGKDAVDGYNNGVRNSIADTVAVMQEWMSAVSESLNLEAFSEMFAGFTAGFQTKWTELTTWWSEEAYPTWYEESLTPAFSEETWYTLTDGMKTGIMTKWTEFVDLWKTEFAKWWKLDIEPYFSLKQWQLFGTNMRDGIRTGFEGIVGDVAGILKRLTLTFQSAMNQIVDAVNEFVDDYNRAAKIMGTSTLDRFQHFDFGDIMQYKFGGFPESASLFWAGENGVAEMVGTVGGKTAVASGAEITGIRDAIENMEQSNVNLQNTVISLLQVIADKDPTIELDGREVGSVINARNSRNGWSFT